MAEYLQKKVRRDSEGNILGKGESYKVTRGLYTYRYKDYFGEEKEISAATLEKLRQKERVIARDLIDGINTAASRGMTLNKAFDMWAGRKETDIAIDTLSDYIAAYKKNVHDTKIGKKIGRAHV